MIVSELSSCSCLTSLTHSNCCSVLCELKHKDSARVFGHELLAYLDQRDWCMKDSLTYCHYGSLCVKAAWNSFCATLLLSYY